MTKLSECALRPLIVGAGHMPGGDWTVHLFVVLPCGCCAMVLL